MRLTNYEKIEKKEAEIIELRETLRHLKIYEQQLSVSTPMDKEKMWEVKKQIKSVERKITSREYAICELQTRIANNNR